MKLYTFSLSPFAYFVVCVPFLFDVVPELYGLSICERFSLYYFFYFLFPKAEVRLGCAVDDEAMS